MAMTMTGEATLPAARPVVWTMLNDPDVLLNCIPGCQSLSRVGDNGFTAVSKVKIGPVVATFKGKVELSDIVPNVGYTISGEGEGGVAGFAKGGARVTLADADGGGTVLRYNVEAHVGGKIAQLGSRLIDGVAKAMADKFFLSFAEEAAKAGPVSAKGRRPGHTEAQVMRHYAAAHPTGAPIDTFDAPLGAPAAGFSQKTPPPDDAAAAAIAAFQAQKASQTKKKSWLRRIWEWFMSH
jgi:carbon monoxide dehydrogenase subunit G